MGKSKKKNTIKITDRQALVLSAALETLGQEIMEKPLAMLIGDNDGEIFDDIRAVEDQIAHILSP